MRGAQNDLTGNSKRSEGRECEGRAAPSFSMETGPAHGLGCSVTTGGFEFESVDLITKMDAVTQFV
jgi:hypothetical protein